MPSGVKITDGLNTTIIDEVGMQKVLTLVATGDTGYTAGTALALAPTAGDWKTVSGGDAAFTVPRNLSYRLVATIEEVWNGYIGGTLIAEQFFGIGLVSVGTPYVSIITNRTYGYVPLQLTYIINNLAAGSYTARMWARTDAAAQGGASEIMNINKAIIRVYQLGS